MTTFVGTPITVRGEVFGNIYLTEKEGGEPFDESDEQLLIVLSEWSAVAINNARTHEEIRRGRADLERLVQGLQATASLSRELGGESDLDRVLELVTKRARALLEARSSYVLLQEGADLVVRGAAGEGGVRSIGRAVGPGSGTAGFIGDGVEPADRAGRRRVAGGARDRFERRSRRSAALAGAGSRRPPRRRSRRGRPVFSADQQLTLESFATSAANAIAAAHAIEDEKAKLAIASSERERGRWARELHDETLQELGALRIMQEHAARARRSRRCASTSRPPTSRSQRTVSRPPGPDRRAPAGGTRPARHRGGDRSADRPACDALGAPLRGRHRPRLRTRRRASPAHAGARVDDLPARPGEPDQRDQACRRNARPGRDRGARRTVLVIRVEDDGTGFDLRASVADSA